MRVVESGSRAWGVESPDSDYDVRFIYVRSEEDYLRLEPKRDVIEWKLDEVLDINGWDLKKTLVQIHKGNANIFEWANSPIVYKDTEEWQRIYEVCRPYFSVKSAWAHYVGLARSTSMRFLQEEKVSYKKYIYALRPLLTCMYIEKTRGIPPVRLRDLLSQELPKSFVENVENMLQVKEQENEKTLNPRIKELDEFIGEKICHFEELIANAEDDRIKEWEPLDRAFLDIISQQ